MSVVNLGLLALATRLAEACPPIDYKFEGVIPLVRVHHFNVDPCNTHKFVAVSTIAFRSGDDSTGRE